MNALLLGAVLSVASATEVRFLNALPTDFKFDVWFGDVAEATHTDLGYKDISDFYPVEPGTHVLAFYPAGTSFQAVYNISVEVMADSYTTYVIELAGSAFRVLEEV